MIIFLIVTNSAKIVTNLTNIVTWFVLTDDWLLVVASHIMPLDTCTDGQENSNKSGGQKYRIKFSCHLIPVQILRKG